MSPESAAMNPLAVEANEVIEQNAPTVMRMLSDLGKQLYFPKGILTQTAEANEKAHRFNATIGEARELRHSMGLPAITSHLVDVGADDVLPYASSYGRADLRAAWQAEMREKNPSLARTSVSLPVVTTGITHGLSTVADMFVDEGDVLLLPDKLWGNYRLVFGTRRGAKIDTYPLLDMEQGFDVEGLRAAVQKHAVVGKIVILFNFPNNPTGYSVTPGEADSIREIVVEAAEGGCHVVTVFDDAYFGLFYDEEVLKESVFTRLADAHERVLAIKLDGASKEDYAWGLRVAFITYNIKDGSGAYGALEKKTAGCVRGTISNSPNVSQALVLKAMSDPEYKAQKAEKYAVLAARAAKVRKLLGDPKFDGVWKLYPFNSGYFFTVRLLETDAEEYRVKLLNDYGVGVISTSKTDVRVALSCVDEEELDSLVELMLECALEMKKK